MPKQTNSHIRIPTKEPFLTDIAVLDFFSLREVVFIAVRYFSISKPQRINIFFFMINGRFSLL